MLNSNPKSPRLKSNPSDFKLSGVQAVLLGIMETKMETTIISRVHIGVPSNIIYRVQIGVPLTIIYEVYILGSL